MEPMDAFAKPRRPVGGAGRGGALAAFAAPPANRITVGKGRWASVRQELVDVGIGTGEKLCGNQKFAARSCRIAASSSAPSTRRLLEAWRCRFLSARQSQDGRVIAEK